MSCTHLWELVCVEREMRELSSYMFINYMVKACLFRWWILENFSGSNWKCLPPTKVPFYGHGDTDSIQHFEFFHALPADTTTLNPETIKEWLSYDRYNYGAKYSKENLGIDVSTGQNCKRQSCHRPVQALWWSEARFLVMSKLFQVSSRKKRINLYVRKELLPNAAKAFIKWFMDSPLHLMKRYATWRIFCSTGRSFPVGITLCLVREKWMELLKHMSESDVLHQVFDFMLVWLSLVSTSEALAFPAWRPMGWTRINRTAGWR